MFSLTATEIGGAFLFLRKDFPQNRNICETVNVLNDTGLCTIVLLNIVIVVIIVIISFIWASVLLQKKKTNEIPNASCSYSESNRALLITLVVYVSLLIPVVVTFFLRMFVGIAQILMVVNVLMLLFFMNNVINPFIYYLTVKEFKQGYRNLLFCKSTKKNNNRAIELAVIES